MAKAYRTAVPRPDHEREKASSGSGPVKTYKMSPEEMEDHFARIADKIPKVATNATNAPNSNKGVDPPMKSINSAAQAKQAKQAQEGNKHKAGPDKKGFLKSIAAGNTIAATERAMGLKANVLAYWIKKWGLVGITPGKARGLLDGKVEQSTDHEVPEAHATQNASLVDYEKQLSEWASLKQELQQVKLENMNLKKDHEELIKAHEASSAGAKSLYDRCQELESKLAKWSDNDDETQELLLEITAERDQLHKRVVELNILIGEMTEDRDNWKQTAQEAKQAVVELEAEYQQFPSVLLTSDNVNSPDHYTQGGIETIDFIRAKLTPEEFVGYCKGNILKYVSRASLKGGEEDLRKAGKYINFAVGGGI